jgi:dihydroflavonol-4-reductase
MERAFVTGVTGFVGANLVRELIKQGRVVRVLVRPESDRRNLPSASTSLEVFEGDLKDFDSVKRAVQGCKEVYHVAADYRFWSIRPEEIYENNVQGTQNLLSAALQTGVNRFIHTSTVGTIGLADQPIPCHEETLFAGDQFSSHYKKSKLQAERLALSYVNRGLPVIVVNPSTPIGPWDRKPTPTGKIIVDFLKGKIPAYVNTGLNFIHVKDVAIGHINAASKGRIGERYILGNRNLTMLEFLKILSTLSGKKAPKIRIPYEIAWVTGLFSTGYANWISKKYPAVPLEAVKMSKRYMFFDSSKAIKELDLPQTTVESAAAEALEWFLDGAKFQYQ